MLDKILDFIARFISNKVLPHLVWEGDVIDLGNVTIGSDGYTLFNVNVPSGATTIGYRIRWSTNTSTFSILPYYENPADQFVIGTPGAKITNLKVIPVYLGGGIIKVGISMLSAIERWWEYVRQNTFVYSWSTISANQSTVPKWNNNTNAGQQDNINSTNNNRIQIRLLDSRINAWMVRIGISRNRKQSNNKFLACRNTKCTRDKRYNKSLGIVCKGPACLTSERGCASC